MSLAAGTITKSAVGPTTASLDVSVATGGTAPYAYQWYRSQTSGFTPGVGNAISGATALHLDDSGLIPNVIYYYKVVVTDSVSATATTSQFSLTTLSAAPNINQFAQSAQLGMIDLRFDFDTVSAEIDSTQSTPLYGGSAVKIVDSLDGIPKVVGCTANSDEVFGFINYDIKSQAFNAGDRVELSQAGNVIYLYASGAISRGAQVTLDVATAQGTVAQLVASSGADVVGWAYDKAAGYGSLIRVRVSVPSFAKA